MNHHHHCHMNHHPDHHSTYGSITHLCPLVEALHWHWFCRDRHFRVHHHYRHMKIIQLHYNVMEKLLIFSATLKFPLNGCHHGQHHFNHHQHHDHHYHVIIGYDSFSDVPESRVWFASKNLTPCRMHWNDFLIGQIIAECHSFPNMYDM